MTIGPWNLVLYCDGKIETCSIIFTRTNAKISPILTCQSQIGPCYFSIPVRTHSPPTKSKRCATDEPFALTTAFLSHLYICNLLQSIAICFHPLAPKTLHLHDLGFF